MKCFEAGKKIVETLNKAGFTAYFAGGWVRDYLLNKKSNDIDIATDATPDDILSLFEKTIPVGINYAIIIVVEDELHFEVATFRKDEQYEDGRRPSKISFCSPKEDAKRRDFTINGMFFDPNKEVVLDYVNGKNDLENKVIRAIGDPNKRFTEDRLRMIRACRYSARFSFSIAPDTIDAIIEQSAHLLDCVAIERVYDEFKKMTHDPHLFDALLLMHRLSLLEAIFDDLDLSYEELEKRLKKIKKFPKATYPIVYIFQLFDSPTLEKKIALCKFFKVSNKEISFCEKLHLWENSRNMSPVKLVSLYADKNNEILQKLSNILVNDTHFISFHEKYRKDLSSHIARMQSGRALVSSKDLINAGIKPGKGLGLALKEAEAIAITKNLSNKQSVLSLLQLENYK